MTELNAVQSPRTLIQQIVEEHYQIDVTFPVWARRSHPLVKRQLGIYWRGITPQFDVVAQWYLVQAVVLLLAYPVNFLWMIIIPLVIISVALLPLGVVYYLRMLYQLANEASQSMVTEIENATLPLILTTPYTLREIMLCKVAAVMWRQSENFSLVMSAIVFSQMPTVVLVYLNTLNPATHGFVSHVFMVAAFGVALIRIPLEATLASMLGLYIGTITNGRSTAAASTIALLVFYFTLINMPRLLPLPILALVLVDLVLPLVIPVLLIVGLLWLTERVISDQ